MSYQVLARKWRPKKFKELMGQEHVVTVLVNALAQQRLHHAYLFTGTRGVGKTTIARIFAKSLNCQTGITSEPCGECDTCLDIDLGRFVDLIEIDAASKTKVDDTREILDNVQYAPTSGRYKVYLIDEVHMLSRSSFNALLKTLEEPPEHVKFILATTDPQKLPITVLSRCLQFHLKALTVSQIEQQLNIILAAENVNAEAGSVTLLAKAARGSMRDSLSLTDQSIAQGSGEITLSNVQKMLGGVDQSWVYKILIALIKQDAQQLMTLSLHIASYSPSYSRLMAELIQLLHQIAMVQIVDKHFDLSPEQEVLLRKFAQALSPEDVQLYYQIVLNGRKDLPYAADEQAAFDMILLRLLAFKPITNVNEIAQNELPTPKQSAVTFDDVELKESMEHEPNSKATNSAPQNIAAKHESMSTADIGNAQDSLSEVEASEALNTENDNIAPETDVHEALVEQMADIEQLAAEQSAPELPLTSIDSEQNHNNNNISQHTETNAVKSEFDKTAEANVEHKAEHTPEAEAHPIQQVTPVNTEEPEYDMPDYSESDYYEEYSGENYNNSSPNLTTSNESTTINESNSADVGSTNNPAQVHESASSSGYSSPVQSALATRNILRSRKKEMEAKVKKSSDASTRHNKEETELEKTVVEEVAKPIEIVIDEPYRPELIDPSMIKSANQVDKWANMIDSMALSARIRQIAIHATICDSSTDEKLILQLDQSTKHLKNDTAVAQLEESLTHFLKKPINVEINVVEATEADPYKIQTDINGKRYEYAVTVLKEDDVVKALQEKFQAELDESTIAAL